MERTYDSFAKLLKTYPALSAALVNLGIFIAGYLGLKITAAQLVAFVGVANVLLGLVVHSNVMPLTKVSTALTELDEANKAEASNVNAPVHGYSTPGNDYLPTHGEPDPGATQMFPVQKEAK